MEKCLKAVQWTWIFQKMRSPHLKLWEQRKKSTNNRCFIGIFETFLSFESPFLVLNPGSSPRANQCWSELFQRLHKFQQRYIINFYIINYIWSTCFPQFVYKLKAYERFLAGRLCYRHIYGGLRKISAFQMKMTPSFPSFQRYPRWISFFMENCSLLRFFHAQMGKLLD